MNNSLTWLVKSKPVKQEVSRTVILPPVVSVLCQLGIVAFWGSTLSSGKQSFTIGNKNDQTDAKDCMWKGLMLLAQDW